MPDNYDSQDPILEHLQEEGYPSPEAHPQQDLPPGGGRLAVPHFLTFGQILNSAARTYRWTYDEAARDSDTNKLAIRRDLGLMDALRTRQLPTVQFEWHLEPRNKQDQAQQEGVKILTEVIQQTPRFQQLLLHLMEALWYGRYGVQMVYQWDWSSGDKRLVVRDFRPLNGDKIVFKWSGQAGVLVHSAYQGPWQLTDRGRAHFFTPQEREQIIIHKHEPEDADFNEGDMAGAIHGVGIRSRVYWFWWLKTKILNWLMDYLERVGAGGFTVYFYEAGNDTSLNEVSQAAQTQITNNVILFPRYKDNGNGGPGILRVEPSNGGAQLLGSLIQDYFDVRIRRYILGESVTAESQGLNIGNGGVELDQATFGRRIKYDTGGLQETLTEDFVKVLAKYNTPGMPAPLWKFDVDKPNAPEVLQAASAFWNMGGDIDADELRSIIGLSTPSPGSNVLSKLSPVQPAGIGAVPAGVPMVGPGGPQGPGGDQPIPQGAEDGAQGQPQDESGLPFIF